MTFKVSLIVVAPLRVVAPATVKVPSSTDAFETKSCEVVAVPVIASEVPVALMKVRS